MRHIWFIFLILTVVLSGCMRMSTGDEGSEAEAKTTLKDLEPAIEARQFFADPNCVVWNEGFALSELKRFCEDLYRAGSPKVMFGNCDPLEGKKLSALFVAELPKDKATRDRVIGVWEQGADGGVGLLRQAGYGY